MNKEKNKIKLGPLALLTVVLMGTPKLSEMPIANAEEITMEFHDSNDIKMPQGVKKGEFFETDLTVDGIKCYGYVVTDGDCLEKISQKTCSKLYGFKNWDENTKYMVCLYKLNKMKSNVVVEGNVILVPANAIDMIDYYMALEKSGENILIINEIKRQDKALQTQESKYLVNVDFVLNKLASYYERIGYDLSNVCLDPDSAVKFLENSGLDEKFTIDFSGQPTEDAARAEFVWSMYEGSWNIPSLDLINSNPTDENSLIINH